MSLFDKFDALIDEDVKKDILDAEQGISKFEFPSNQYNVVFEELELTESKNSGNPMVKATMRIVSNGDYNGKHIYHYLNLVDKKGKINGFLVKSCNEFLSNLGSEVEVKLEKFSSFAEIIDKIFLFTKQCEYKIELTYTPDKIDPAKKYSKIEIIEATKYLDD